MNEILITERQKPSLDRVSMVMLAVPCIIILATSVLIGIWVLGGRELSAYTRFFSGARIVWLVTGVVGLLGAASAAISRGGGRARLLMAIHLISLFVAWCAAYLQYMGHPD
jgi:hypothetical protein